MGPPFTDSLTFLARAGLSCSPPRLPHTVGIGVATHLRDHLPDDLDGVLGPAGLGRQDFARLVDDEDAARRALGGLLEADGADQAGVRVAEEGIRE